MPPKGSNKRRIALLKHARATKKEKKLEKGQTVLSWSSKGGQKGNSGRAHDGPQVVTIFMFSSKQLLGQWGFVVL